MPDSTLRMTSSEIRRREHERLGHLEFYRELLRRPDLFDSVSTRENAKQAVRGYYETMNKGMLLDDLASENAEDALVDMDELVVAEMKRLEPGLHFLTCMQHQRYTDARQSLTKILARLEIDYIEQKDYVRTLDTGKV